MDRKPFIIPVFIPHSGCPHRCVFCNQRAITGESRMPDPDQLKMVIDTYLAYDTKDRHPVQISFYGGTFLGLDDHHVACLLDLAENYIAAGKVDSIRFSTRPDTVTRKKLALLRRRHVRTVEIGVQSMDDGVLRRSNRGHRAQDTETAVLLLKTEGYEIGLQMMTGLPGSSDDQDIETARCIANLGPDFVRIYPTLVIDGSPLAELYRKGDYAPSGLDDAVELTKRIYLMFEHYGIPVIRMGLQASEELNHSGTVLAGPYHPAFGHLVHSSVYLDMARRILKEELTGTQNRPVDLYVNPKNISKLRGLKNSNIDVLKSEFDLLSIRVSGDDSIKPDSIKIRQHPGEAGSGRNTDKTEEE